MHVGDECASLKGDKGNISRTVFAVEPIVAGLALAVGAVVATDTEVLTVQVATVTVTGRGGAALREAASAGTHGFCLKVTKPTVIAVLLPHLIPLICFRCNKVFSQNNNDTYTCCLILPLRFVHHQMHLHVKFEIQGKNLQHKLDVS